MAADGQCSLPASWRPVTLTHVEYPAGKRRPRLRGHLPGARPSAPGARARINLRRGAGGSGWELSNSEPWRGSAGARAAQAQWCGDELGEIVSGSLAHFAAARPGRYPRSWVDCNGEGVCVRRERITGLDLGPSSASSPEPERPDSLPGLLGVPVSLSVFGLPVKERAPRCWECANPGQAAICCLSTSGVPRP